MITKKSILTTLLTLLFISFSFIGCNDENSIVDPTNTNNDQEVLKKIAEEDELIQSFEANYNEDEAMGFVFGKISTEIFPVKVGQRIRPIDFEERYLGTFTQIYSIASIFSCVNFP